MLNDSGRDVASAHVGHGCDCYRRLDLLEIPLYIGEEKDEYAEREDEVPPEQAFPVPKFVSINDKIREYPIVEDNDLSYVFLKMIEVIPELSDFEINVLSFWMMDMFIEGLQTAQESGMSHQHQRATLEWIAYLFNYVQKNVVTRIQVSNHLKRVLFKIDIDADDSEKSLHDEELETFKSSESINDHVTLDSKSFVDKDSSEERVKVWTFPLPPGVPDPKESNTEEDGFDDDSNTEIYTTVDSETEERGNSTSNYSSTSLRDKEISERNVADMKIALEILYRIFGRLWVFQEIQNAFHMMPSVETVNLPYTLNVPKQLKQEMSSLTKTEKPGKKPFAPEEVESEREFYKNDYILPLQASEEVKAYMKTVVGLPSEGSFSVKGGKGLKK